MGNGGEDGKGFLQGGEGGRALGNNAVGGFGEGPVLMELAVVEVQEAEGVTLVEAVEIMNLTPVEVEEDPSTVDKISRMNVATKHPVTVR